MKKVFLVLFLLSSSSIIFSQSFELKIHDALQSFRNKEYGKAYREFSLLEDNLEGGQEVLVEYFKGLSLAKMDIKDGSANDIEEFLLNNAFSNYREELQIILGYIYYKSSSYIKSIKTLNNFISEYPNSLNRGTVNYLIGSAYLQEGMLSNAEEFLLKAKQDYKRNRFIPHTIYNLGVLKEKEEKYDEAVKYYDELLNKYYYSTLAPFAQFRIGICYFNTGHYDNVILELSDPLIKKLNESEIKKSRLLLANSYFRLGEYEKAKEVYEKLMNKRFDEGSIDEIKYGLAWIDFQLKNYNSAYKDFIKLSESKVDSIKINSLFWAAECKRYFGETDGAVDLYNNFAELYPEHKLVPRVNFNTALIYYNDEEYDAAVRYLIKSLASNNKDIKLKSYTLLGEISLNKREFSEAENYFNEAFNLGGKNSTVNRARLGLGIAKYFLGKYKEAINVLFDLSIDEKRFEKGKVNYYLAESYFATGNYKNAIKHYNRVGLAEKELRKSVLYGKALAYFNHKDFDNAIYYLNEYISKYPKDRNVVDFKLRIADSYYAIKQFKKASDIYRKIYSSYSSKLKSPYSYYQYGQALFQAGYYEKAVSVFNRLIKSFSKSKYAPEAKRLIGWIYFKKGDYPRAIKEYEELILEFPKSDIKPSAYYLIGDSYYNMAKYDTAISYYKTLIYQFPNTHYIFDAINGIEYSYLAKGQPDSAIVVIDGFTKEYTNSKYIPDVMLKKATILFNEAKYNEAINVYLELINKYPKSTLLPKAYLGVVDSYIGLNDKENAKTYLYGIINQFGKTDEAITAGVNYSNFVKNSNNGSLEISKIDELINKNKTNTRITELLFIKGENYLATDSLALAYNTFNDIVNNFYGDVFVDKAKIELSIMNIALSKFNDAEKLLLEVAESRSDEVGAKAQYYLGYSYFENGNIEDAINSLVRVRSVFSNYPEWYYKALLLLGDCYVKIGDKRNAKAMYRAVYKKHKNDELGKEANKKMKKL